MLRTPAHIHTHTKTPNNSQQFALSHLALPKQKKVLQNSLSASVPKQCNTLSPQKCRETPLTIRPDEWVSKLLFYTWSQPDEPVRVLNTNTVPEHHPAALFSPRHGWLSVPKSFVFVHRTVPATVSGLWCLLEGWILWGFCFTTIAACQDIILIYPTPGCYT